MSYRKHERDSVNPTSLELRTLCECMTVPDYERFWREGELYAWDNSACRGW